MRPRWCWPATGRCRSRACWVTSCPAARWPGARCCASPGVPVPVRPRSASSWRPRSPRWGSGRARRRRRHLRSARRGRRRGGAGALRGGPAGAPRPLGHRGRSPARRREPGAGRGAARGRPGRRPPAGGACPRARVDAGRRRDPRRVRGRVVSPTRCTRRDRRGRTTAPASWRRSPGGPSAPSGGGGPGCRGPSPHRRARPGGLHGRESERPRRTCALWCPDWPVVAARRLEPGVGRHTGRRRGRHGSRARQGGGRRPRPRRAREGVAVGLRAAKPRRGARG